MENTTKHYYIRRFFAKDPEQLTLQDLRDFIAQKIEENQHLEYKPRGLLVRQDDSLIKNNYKQGFYDLAKTITGFANAEGGLLILGVKETEQKDQKGVVIAKLPQVKLHPLPITVTKEMIENQLRTIINFPVENMTIVPLKIGRSQKYAYIIEVPASLDPPHRVGNGAYYQRHNFSTHELEHFQIMDIIGRRKKPIIDDVELQVEKIVASNSLRVRVSFINKGSAVAKYFTCVAALTDPRLKMVKSSSWLAIETNPLIMQHSMGNRTVIYPGISHDTGYFDVALPQNSPPKVIELTFRMLAEDMPIFDSVKTLTIF